MAEALTPPTTPPAPFGEGAFVCAFCGAQSQQNWYASILVRLVSREFLTLRPKPPGGRPPEWYEQAQGIWPFATERGNYSYEFAAKCPSAANAYWSECCNPKCRRLSLWIGGRLQFPDSSNWMPNADLPEDIKRDFLEAASIVARSPRGAAALLRLCIQKICVFLEKDPDNLNNAIAELVEAGLPERVSQMLDIVRVTGNEAVHPGTMDLRDDKQTVENLFKLVNLIADELLTRPREADEIWNTLPEEKRKQVEQRNARIASKTKKSTPDA